MAHFLDFEADASDLEGEEDLRVLMEDLGQTQETSVSMQDFLHDQESDESAADQDEGSPKRARTGTPSAPAGDSLDDTQCGDLELAGHTCGLIAEICGARASDVVRITALTDSVRTMHALALQTATSLNDPLASQYSVNDRLADVQRVLACGNDARTRRLVETALILDQPLALMRAFIVLRDRFRDLHVAGEGARAEPKDLACIRLFLQVGGDIFRLQNPKQTIRCITDVIDVDGDLRALIEPPRFELGALSVEQLDRLEDEADFSTLDALQSGPPPATLTQDQARAPFLTWNLMLSKLAALTRGTLPAELERDMGDIQNRLNAMHGLIEGRRVSTLPSDTIRSMQLPSNIRTYRDFETPQTSRGNKLYCHILELLCKSCYYKDEFNRVVSKVFIGGRFAYAYSIEFSTVHEAVMSTHSSTKNPEIFPLLDLNKNDLLSVAHNLENYNEDIMFPRIKRERTLMSFNDGVLDLRNLIFVPLKNVAAALPPNTCSCVFHDLPLRGLWDIIKEDIHPPGMEPQTRADAERQRVRSERLHSQEALRTMLHRKATYDARESVKARICAEAVAMNMPGAAMHAFVGREITSAATRTIIEAEASRLYSNFVAAEEAAVSRLFSSRQERADIARFRPFSKELYVNIPTPTFDRMIFHQLRENPPGDDFLNYYPTLEEMETYKVVLAALGRLFFDVGSMDSWDVMPWILGVSGSGKSCLLRLIEKCYGQDDIGIMSNNVEDPFGISPLRKSYVVLGFEIGHGFKLPQRQWLSMVVGEQVSAPAKNKNPETRPWTQGMLYVGNGMPAWYDNQGQCVRRILLLMFKNPVDHQDPGLVKLLIAERGAFILKAVCAYHALRAKVGPDHQLWDHIPEYFKKGREALERMMNPLTMFLTDPNHCVLDATKSTSRRVFDRALRTFLCSKSITHMPTENDLTAAFRRHAIHIEPDRLRGIFVQEN